MSDKPICRRCVSDVHDMTARRFTEDSREDVTFEM